MHSGTESIPPLIIRSVCCSAAQILNHLHECLGTLIYNIVGNKWKQVDACEWRSSCCRQMTCVVALFKNHVSLKRPKTDYSYNINFIILYKIVQLAFLTMCMINFHVKMFFQSFFWKKRGGTNFVPPWIYYQILKEQVVRFLYHREHSNKICAIWNTNCTARDDIFFYLSLIHIWRCRRRG